MKKITTVLAVSVMLVLLLAGCGSKSEDVRCAEAAKAAVEKLELTDMDTTVSYGEDVYEENFQRLYNFSMDQADDGVIVYASDGGKADEISIIHAADSSEVSGIKKYMEARLEKRLKDFQNYKPKEVSKIENGKVVVQQQYIILVISDKADDIVTALREGLS